MSVTHNRILNAARQCTNPNVADTLELIHILLNRYTDYEVLDIYEIFADKIELMVQEHIGEDMTDAMIRLISIMRFSLTSFMNLVEEDTWWNVYKLKHKILHLLEKSCTGDPRSLMDLAASSIVRGGLDTKSLPECLQHYVWYKSACQSEVQLRRIEKRCMCSDCNDVIDIPPFLFEEK